MFGYKNKDNANMNETNQLNILDILDSAELGKTVSFVSRMIDLFKDMYAESDMYNDERILFKTSKIINDNFTISCEIINCEDISNFASFDTAVLFKFTSMINNDTGHGNTKKTIVIAGSGTGHGCTMEEAKEFLNILKEYNKRR